MTRKITACFVLALCLAVNSAVEAQGYVRRTLFTLGYGHAANEVGLLPPPLEGGPPTGPGDIAVDSSGNIVISDNANQRIVKFDANGHPLMQAGAENVSAIAANGSTGEVYVVGGAGAESIIWPSQRKA